jgi:predicted DNA-binding transcriptional regulator YafY
MALDLERKLVLLSLLAGSRQACTREEIFKKLPTFYSLKKRKLGSAKKMFERDKTELLDSGFLILAEPMGDGEFRYRLHKPSEIFDRQFALTLEQTQTLRALLEDPLFVGQIPGIALAALSKLLAFHGRLDVPSKTITSNLQKEDHNLTLALQAGQEERAIEVDYPSHINDKMERRIFSPYGAFLRTGNTYLVVWCHRDHVPKVLDMKRVGTVRLAREDFHPKPDALTIEHYSQTHNWISVENRGHKIVLKVNGNKAYRVKERHPFAITQENADGSVKAVYWVTNLPRYFKFVLSFGRDAEILEPPEVRKEFHKFLERAR